MGDPDFDDAARITRDPATVKSRIFIGNTPNSLNKKNIEEIFAPYGKVIAVVVNRGFSFLQYSNEKSAQDAIDNECGRVFDGKKLDVKHAVAFNKNRNKDKSPDRIRDRSPLNDRDRDRDDGNDRMGGPYGDHRMDMPRNDRFGSGFGGGPPRDIDNFPSTEYPIGVGNLPGEPRFGPGHGPGFGGRSLRNNDDSFPSTEYPIGNGPFPDRSGPMMPPREPFHGPVMHSDRINDCEIIVLNRNITMDYANFVERRLKDLGLSVDVLFPNEDVPLGRILANISGRGALYAIVVAPINEQHRSLTVNILYGQHQEHRNMPMDDALLLIRRTFASYMRGERDLPGTVGGFEVHPEALQTLFNLLKENRQLTALQYDKVIRYLQEKREKQLKLEVGDDASDLPILMEANSNSTAAVPVVKQQELQSRIMNILKKKGAVPADEAPGPVPVPDQYGAVGAAAGGGVVEMGGPHPQQGTGSSSQPLLKNPNVQKALDSLMQGDILRKLNPKTPAPVPAPQAMFSAYGPNKRSF